MKILDACCGSRMFWYERNEPHTTYMDIRKEILTCKDRGLKREIEIKPDIVADFRDMPFADATFDLVVFDPPHLIKAGKESWLAKKYGTLDLMSWKSDIQQGFSECLRVLKPNGVLLFKWNEDQIPFKEVLKVIQKQPILGDKKSKTKWSVFIK
ncbi:class I SAM-dependent methyltransferase [Ligilactobacillus agilis]|uniref:class I SAM-dependent methyltransferase n=1 Tax=Ligilactobacillus agilis TaxID=1601 RepID=UPI0025A39AA2|nr:class I SAM-dependent methyltransferase [Ligilactobacillus agilis]MDM8279660.1 class I SAM-dependent methyltransferase [Ligilactobacillus agilis]